MTVVGPFCIQVLEGKNGTVYKVHMQVNHRTFEAWGPSVSAAVKFAYDRARAWVGEEFEYDTRTIREGGPENVEPGAGGDTTEVERGSGADG